MKNIIILMLFFINYCYAGNEVGNGGDGIWCEKTKSLSLLDYYESKSLGLYEIEAPIGNDPYQVAEKILGSLTRLDKKLSDQYQRTLSGMRLRSRFLKDVNLRDIKDSFEISLPKDCEIKQLAIQQKPAGKNEVEFYFDQDYWDKLNVTEQAGLLLHEIIYEHFTFLGEKNSINVRHFNSMIASKEIKQMPAEEFRKKITQLRLPLY